MEENVCIKNVFGGDPQGYTTPKTAVGKMSIWRILNHLNYSHRNLCIHCAYCNNIFYRLYKLNKNDKEKNYWNFLDHFIRYYSLICLKYEDKRKNTIYSSITIVEVD